MTKLAIVAPPAHPYYSMLGDGIALCQAGWAKQNRFYLEHFIELKALGWHIILDWMHPNKNGENAAPTSPDDFLQVMSVLEPTEIIVPDFYQDAEETINMAHSFLHHKLQPDFEGKLMFVPQGETVDEYMWCAQQLCEQWGSSVDTIGIPKYLQQYVNRIDIVDRVLDIGKSSVNIHMLGVWGGLTELAFHPRVRSWDTSLPVAAAQAGDFLMIINNVKYELQDEVAAVNDALLFGNVMACKECLGGIE